MTETYRTFSPTAFDSHLDIDWEPSEALEKARAALERTIDIYEMKADGGAEEDVVAIWQKAVDKAQAAVDALEAVEDKNNWLLVPVERNRDSGPLEESNFEAALEILGGESETVEVHLFNHWACGHFSVIIAHPSRLKDVEDIARALEDYPVLDDEDLSERESEAMDEDWRNWAERDFSKDVLSCLETMCEALSEPESDVERELRELSERYELSDDGIPYDISGKPIKTPGQRAWERYEHIDNNWGSDEWTWLFNECDGEREHTGTETHFRYDAKKCAEYAFENDMPKAKEQSND